MRISSLMVLVLVLLFSACGGAGTHDAASAARTPPVEAAPLQVVYRSAGPDDGPGVTVEIGDVPANRAGCERPRGDERVFPDGAAVRIVLMESFHSLPVNVPAVGTQYASVSVAGRIASGGTIHVTDYEEGAHLRGSYRIETASGVVAGPFDATWCGQAGP